MIILKKIELHCHLDGSLNLEHAARLAGRDVTRDMVCLKNGNLKDYLTKFALPIELLQTEENLTEFSRLLALDLVKDEVIYAEIRFCPLFHTRRGLNPHAVIDAVAAGLRAVPELSFGLILCMMREFDESTNRRIIDIARANLSGAVCGLDLAGDEAAHPNREFEELFKTALLHRIPLTIHAGEADGPTGVDDALVFCTSRIGHGVRAIESSQTVDLLVASQIPLEVCPTSNVNTGIYPHVAGHSIRQLLDAGVAVTINTDNRTVSNTTLSDEYELLRERLCFNDQDFLQCNISAVLGAFAPNDLKVSLIHQLMADYNDRRSRKLGRYAQSS